MVSNSSRTEGGAPLLTIDAARAAIVATARPIEGCEQTPLSEARGRLLAQALTSPRPLPVFDHSAMDGYALHLQDGRDTYRLIGRVAAGHMPPRALNPGEAMRIFTGAPIPPGTDAVVMQENVAPLDGDRIQLRASLRSGDNIRHAGEDVALDELLVPAGTILDARHVGLAAAVGLSHLDVLRRLRIALVSTGDELVSSGGQLRPGQIFDSNRPMLAAALERPSVSIEDFGVLPDDRTLIRAFFADVANRFDLIVTTGGASVGDEDHIAGSLIEAGGRIHMAKVAIRPGKPFTYGEIGGAAVSILPGNPFAALVAGLLFVRPQLERSLGLPVAPFAPLPAAAGFAGPRARERTEFVPARIIGRTATGMPIIDRLGRGGSARLKPLIGADGLAVLAPGEAPVAMGEAIGFLPFGAAFAL